MNDHLRLGLTILVGIGWMFNLVAPAFLPSYDSNLAANGPLLLVLGAVFSVKKKGGGDDKVD